MTQATNSELVTLIEQLRSEMVTMHESYEKRFIAYGKQVDELTADKVALQAEVADLKKSEAALKAQVADLKAKLRTNSRNSSKPPSTDGFTKPAPKSLRRPSGRKSGGQIGHEGTTLTQVGEPDVIFTHDPPACHGCGSTLEAMPVVGIRRTQVFDIPPITLHVSEHQMRSRRCPCGTVTAATAPQGAGAPVQYGPRATAHMIYLQHGQFLSRERTAHALSDLFGAPISPATVTAAVTRGAQGLTDFLTVIQSKITGADVAHFDETGMRVEGRLAWLHSASTPEFSLLHVHPRRGVAAMDDMGVLPGFTGTAVHDAFAPYDTYTSATHALCGAHLLRELIAVVEYHAKNPGAGVGPPNWSWAQQAIDALIQMKNTVDTNNGEALDPGLLDHHAWLIRSAALIAMTIQPTNTVETKHRALGRRIHKRLDDYLRFATDPAIPFDNNAAERQIRMTKIRQKVSGCMRTLTGAQEFAAIRSYTATAKLHGINTLDALVRLTSGAPWIPATT